jgi:cell division transport system permease protein
MWSEPVRGMIVEKMQPVRRALDLRADGIFNLLVVLTALLGAVLALSAGGTLLLQKVYGAWQLERRQTITAYLPAEAAPEAVEKLLAELKTQAGVKGVTRLADSDLRQILQPYGEVGAGLPLPVVLDLRLADDADPAAVEQPVKAAFATAEFDDARLLLGTVAEGVRWLQAIALGTGGVMLALMTLLIVLTVRTGLQARKDTLALLRQLGATDRWLARGVALQVAGRCVLGWAVASAAAVALLLAAALSWPVVGGTLAWSVWLGLAAAPALLVLAATGAAWVAALRVLQK